MSNKRYSYRDANGRHWVNRDDIDSLIIQSAQENVADLGHNPHIIGWDEYGRLVDEMVTAIIESRVADGLEIK